jgi:hypothetical protein
MSFVDMLIAAIVITVLGLAIWYIRKAKKSGRKCIGCPNGSVCSSGLNGGCCACSKQMEGEK